MSDTARLQVDILKYQLEEMERLQRLGGLRTKRELWDTAFTLLKWATKKKALGLPIGSISEDGVFSEMEMPFLEHYAAAVNSEHARTGGTNSDDETSNAETTSGFPTRTRKTAGSNISLAKRKQA